MKNEEKAEVTEIVKAVEDVQVPALNMQASLGFTLVGTNLFALYQRKDDVNTFLIMPALDQSTKGMTVGAMVEEVNNLISGVTHKKDGLDVDSIQKSISDVAEASKTNQEAKTSFDWEKIKVYLKQAFFYLSTGESAQYALEITVDISELFPAGQSFFNVSGLSLGIWNTDKAKVLKRMDLINVEDCLKELEED